MFNYLTDGTGSSTGGVFAYFFWVLLQVGFMVLHAYYLRREQARAPVMSSPTVLCLGPFPGRLHVLHLTEGTGSSTGGVFTYFFWVLLQVGFMVLHVTKGNRLQHWRCLHLLLLGLSPGRPHGPTCSPPHGGDRLQHSTGSVFTYFLWILLHVGFMVLHVLHLNKGSDRLQYWRCLHLLFLGLSPGRLYGPTCSSPHGGDRLQLWWCLHLLLLGPPPGRHHGPTCLLSQEGQAPALAVSSPTSSGSFSR
jgi:hypothetical protein